MSSPFLLGENVSSTERSGEPVELSGGPLGTLFFEWHKDRYQHRWTFDDPAETVASIESDSSVVWPVNPPLQQIHQQSFGDGREIIFGVGMAGRSHWSASFTLVPDLKCWIVELACRAPLKAESLLSSYRLDPSWETVSEDKLQIRRSHSLISLEANPPLTLADRRVGAESGKHSDELIFRPAKIAEGAATTQWAFRLRVET